MNPVQFAPPSQKAAPPPAQRRGACPTLAAPMLTGDGLLVRLRPVDRILSPDQLIRIAALTHQFGNGQIEVTARGNLQVRGLRPQTAAPFVDAVEAIIEIETGLPIDISPLAGLDPQELADPRPIAQAIQAAAEATGLSNRLGPKVAVVIDSAGSIPLCDLTADLRLTATATHWTLDIAGQPFGPIQHAPAAVLALLEAIASLGLDARARDLSSAQIHTALSRISPHTRTSPLPLEGRARVGVPCAPAQIALPFGSASWSSLTDLARAARDLGITELRLAPNHAIIAMAASASIADAFQHSAATLGFITAATDARTHISACIGSAGCASGTIPARTLASKIAASQPDFFDGSFDLHVSGCAKGCAHPRKALLTLVGANGDCRLILNGVAGATPLARIAQADIAASMDRLAALWRDNRALGESVATCFKRLGEAAVVAAVRQG